MMRKHPFPQFNSSFSSTGDGTRESLPSGRKPLNLLESIQKVNLHLDGEVYLVGGFVRNSLIGRSSSDIDIVTTSSSRECAETFRRELGGTLFPLDIPRGIFRLLLNDSNELGISHLDLSEGKGGVLEDLEKRDFTINAMAIPINQFGNTPSDWNVIDPTTGLADLKQKAIRMTHSNVFKEDPIRILRATRLASQLEFEIEKETFQTIQQDRFLLGPCSPERIRDEFLEILSQPNLKHSLEELSRNLVLEILIPELSDAKGVIQPIEHYWDVYDHSIQTAVMAEAILKRDYRENDEIGNSIPWRSWLDEYFSEEVCDGHSRSTILKLAGLLHDVAKPETKTIQPNGRVRFLGHSPIGAAKAEIILSRMRLSNRGITMIKTMVEHHLRPSQTSQKDQMPTRKAVYRYFRDVGEVALDTIYLSLADFLAARGPTLDKEAWLFNSKRINYTIEEGTRIQQIENEPKLLDGHEISHLFDIKPSPELGELINQVRKAQAIGIIDTKQNAVAFIKDLLKGRSGIREFSASGTQK